MGTKVQRSAVRLHTKHIKMIVENWKLISSKTWCFQLGEEPELIHVIKTGFKDMYMVVHEDAYQYDLGKVEMGSREEIENRYNIELNG